MLFFKEYKSTKIKKPNILLCRKKIFASKNKNLLFLLNKRYSWMKKFIKNKKVVIELGSGTGCINKIIKKKIILTDITKYKWIDEKLDMMKLNLKKKYNKKVDVFIINHALHHCANPSLTLYKISKFLKRGGVVLINEPETSFFLKLVQVLLKDEGWKLDVNIFNKNKNIFKATNPWLSNTAVAQLLFKNERKFKKYFPQYKIEKNFLSEFFIFFNSGGLNSVFLHIKLNKFFLKIIDYVDRVLIFFFPSIFALNRSIVLRKIK